MNTWQRLCDSWSGNRESYSTTASPSQQLTKNEHYVLEMWESKECSEPVLIQWTAKSQAKWVWAKSVPYFEKQIASIERYGTQCGKGPKSIAGANIELKEQLGNAINLIQIKEEEHALAMWGNQRTNAGRYKNKSNIWWRWLTSYLTSEGGKYVNLVADQTKGEKETGVANWDKQ